MIRWNLVFVLFLACSGFAGASQNDEPAPFKDKFFPIGIYHVPEDKIDHIQKLGFNLSVACSNSMTYLEKLQARGMKGIPAPGFNNLAANMKERLNHPAIFAWDVMDEPDLNKIPPETIKGMYEQLKATKSPHPAYLTVYRPGRYKDFIGFTDILGLDLYPLRKKDESKNSLRDVAFSLIKAQEADPDKPAIAIMQAFSDIYFPVMPTPEQERCMVYIAITCGSRGIIYFSYNELTSGKATGVLKEVIKLNQELRQLAPILQTAKPALEQKVRIIQMDEKPLEGTFKAGAAASTATVDKSRWFIPHMLRKHQDKYYLFVVNPDNVEHKITVQLPEELRNKPIQGLFLERKVTSEKDLLKDTLKPLEAVIYVF